MRFMPLRLKFIRKDELSQVFGKAQKKWPFYRPAEVIASPP